MSPNDPASSRELADAMRALRAADVEVRQNPRRLVLGGRLTNVDRTMAEIAKQQTPRANVLAGEIATLRMLIDLCGRYGVEVNEFVDRAADEAERHLLGEGDEAYRQELQTELYEQDQRNIREANRIFEAHVPGTPRTPTPAHKEVTWAAYWLAATCREILAERRPVARQSNIPAEFLRAALRAVYRIESRQTDPVEANRVAMSLVLQTFRDGVNAYDPSAERRANPRRRDEPGRLFALHVGEADPEDFDRIFDRPLSRDQRKGLVARRGRSVTWLGLPGRMYRATPAYTSQLPGNLFEDEKLAAVVAGVRAGRKPTFRAAGVHLAKIDLDYVRATQQAKRAERLDTDMGLARAFTTGDEELDEYLADAEEAERAERPADPDRWRAGMEARAAEAQREGRGDLGRYWVRLRGGHHRTLGAFLAGEPFAWVEVLRRPGEDLPPGLLS